MQHGRRAGEDLAAAIETQQRLDEGVDAFAAS
jgi:hypothetical protein